MIERSRYGIPPKEPEKKPDDGYPKSPCCGVSMCYTMWSVYFCSRCGTIIERIRKGEFVKSTSNIFYHTENKSLELNPEELYLQEKGLLDGLRKGLIEQGKRWLGSGSTPRVGIKPDKKVSLEKVKKKEIEKMLPKAEAKEFPF